MTLRAKSVLILGALLLNEVRGLLSVGAGGLWLVHHPVTTLGRDLGMLIVSLVVGPSFVIFKPMLLLSLSPGFLGLGAAVFAPFILEHLLKKLWA